MQLSRVHDVLRVLGACAAGAKYDDLGSDVLHDPAPTCQDKCCNPDGVFPSERLVVPVSC
jgi:hypothetical protein